jgi:hypothetical protein
VVAQVPQQIPQVDWAVFRTPAPVHLEGRAHSQPQELVGLVEAFSPLLVPVEAVADGVVLAALAKIPT